MVKIAFCVEDESDKLVYRKLISRLLEEEVESDETSYRRRTGTGLPQVLALAHTYACRAWASQLDGVLIAIDNDGAPLHVSDACSCARCQLDARTRAAEILRRERAKPFAILFGVPVQVLETWLLQMQGFAFSGSPESYGVDPQGRRWLKAKLYGTERPDRRLMSSVALPIVEKADLNDLAQKSESFRNFQDQVLPMKRARPSSAS